MVQIHSWRAQTLHRQEKTFGYPDALRYQGSVVGRVWLPVTAMSLWSALVFIVASASCSNGARCIAIPSTLITVLSLVLSLLLVFRTNTAYERFWDGRKLWGSLIVSCRNLARIVWVGIDENKPADILEKRAAMKLILAFFVATKNHIRGEYDMCGPDGNVREDMATLIPPKKQEVLAKLENTRSMRSPREDYTSPTDLRHRRGTSGGNTDDAIVDIMSSPTITEFPDKSHVHIVYSQKLLSPPSQRRPSAKSHPSTKSSSTKTAKQHTRPYRSIDMSISEVANLPIDISHLLSAYIITQRKNESIDAPQFSVTIAIVSSMIDTLTNLERILTTPIPIAYNIHLKQALYMYFLLLPFQVTDQIYKYYDPLFGGTGKSPNIYGALSILIIFLTTFIFLGVESIGAEIENPFGEDQNDLPLDQYVADMRSELDILMHKPPIQLADWDLTPTTLSPNTTSVNTLSRNSPMSVLNAPQSHRFQQDHSVHASTSGLLAQEHSMSSEILATSPRLKETH